MLDEFGAVSKGDGGILSKLKRNDANDTRDDHQGRWWAAPALCRDIEIGVPGEGLDVDMHPRCAACGPLVYRRVRATDGYGS